MASFKLKFDDKIDWFCIDHAETIEYSITLEVIPAIGMGATALVGSDRYPFTIVDILSDKTIVVQRDDYKATAKSTLENQEYTYTPNREAIREVLTLRKNGAWVVKGESMKNGSRFAIGFRRHYSDPSF